MQNTSQTFVARKKRSKTPLFLCNLSIDIFKRVCYTCRPALAGVGRIFIIPPCQQFVKRKTAQIFSLLFSRNCAKQRNNQKGIAILRKICYIIYVVKRGYTPMKTDRHQPRNGKQIGGIWKDFPKNFSKFFEKSIDKACRKCYNDSTR